MEVRILPRDLRELDGNLLHTGFLSESHHNLFFRIVGWRQELRGFTAFRPFLSRGSWMLCEKVPRSVDRPSSFA